MDPPLLRKGLGQHHLRDSSLCGPLVQFLEPSGQRVVEIGPGGGVLTGALLAAGARVLAWELDRAWAFEVARRFAANPSLQVVNGDALELTWDRLPAPAKVAGNLPYNVATALIDRMLEHGERVARAAFLVQLEVAERLVARPGDKAYGATSVLTEARAEARILGRVRPGSFVPPPKVESAFVGLLPRADTLPADRLKDLRGLVYAAFGQRRKTLRNALASRWPRERAATAIERAGLPAGVRAERVSCSGFLELLNRLDSV
jgi:16S rRNA (adenine1518-N6/adenine1519-N6)-dimethyltransferase